jgi:4-hydroxy-tetrahydrodipicolinate synthase
MLDETASGVYTIAATPFLPDGALDLDSIDRMVDFYLEKGATGLTILGMMGEAGKLSASESVTVIQRVTGRTDVPVVVGVTATGFAPMRALSLEAMDAGAAAVMVNYYYNTATALGDIPFVLQDFPLATGIVIPTSVVQTIVDNCPTCVMLKHEDWPGLDKISTLRATSDAGGRRISILCGNGGMYLPEEMGRGADGAMTGFSFPEMMTQVIAAHHAGDRERAYDIFDAYLSIIRYEAQPGMGLAIRKHILARRGAIAHPTVRAPGAGLGAAAIAELDVLMARQTRRLADLGLPG